MSVIYLSGPISLGGACTPDEIDAFSEVFTLHEQRLVGFGHDVINPCNCEPQESWEDYMRVGIGSLCLADMVAVLPRWLESRGAVLEAYIARQLGIPVVAVESVAQPFDWGREGRAG